MFQKQHCIAIFLIILSSFSAYSATDQGIQPTSGHFRLTYDNLSLPHHEKMGLAGGTILYDLNHWFSLGPATYAAITGERGGFITLGMASNVQTEITDLLSVDGGFFVGAGGGDGGYTLVGGGLMLRGHLGLYVNMNQWGSVGVGASYIGFPNGHINSFQPYFAYQYPFETLIGTGWIKDLVASREENSLPSSHREFAVVYKTYFIPNNVVNRSGGPQHRTIDLLGAEWYRYYFDRLFFKIESEGAMGGRSNGYMQILAGGGYRHPVTASTFIKLAGQIGGAGGGSVATGGGLLVDGALSLQQYLTQALYLSVNGGYTAAPTGKFKASSVGVQLGYGYDVPTVGKSWVPFTALSDYAPIHMRIRGTNQTYFKANPRWRSHHQNENVNLLGLQIDYFATPMFYLTGQGLGAYQGNAGAYMTGLLGAGLYEPISQSPVFINLEALFGAAGGGGLQVGGGFVAQANAGLGYQFNDAFSIMGYYGYIGAPQGYFRANVLGIAFGYNFTLFAKPGAH